MQMIEIVVSGKTFSIELFDTKPARALAALLPLQADMQELNGNEKYIYLSDSLPTAKEQPNHIHAGDLMLFGSDCLVLFYKDFPTSYEYTPLGRIADAKYLSEALGSGAVSVTFQKIPS